MQLMNQVVLMKVLLPQNSLEMTKIVTDITGFQFWQTEYMDEILYEIDLDELEPFSDEMERAGHDSNLFIMNIGTP